MEELALDVEVFQNNEALDLVNDNIYQCLQSLYRGLESINSTIKQLQIHVKSFPNNDALPTFYLQLAQFRSTLKNITLLGCGHRPMSRDESLEDRFPCSALAKLLKNPESVLRYLQIEGMSLVDEGYLTIINSLSGNKTLETLVMPFFYQLRDIDFTCVDKLLCDASM